MSWLRRAERDAVGLQEGGSSLCPSACQLPGLQSVWVALHPCLSKRSAACLLAAEEEAEEVLAHLEATDPEQATDAIRSPHGAPALCHTQPTFP